MLDFTRFYYALFALLTIAGGVIGYFKAHSKPSIVAGSISGILLLVAAYLLRKHMNVGLILGLLVSVLLAGKFVPDFIHKKAIMPAGMMSVLSIAGLVVTILAWYKR